MAGRFDNLREIQRLNPERDCQRIMHLSFGYEFCWDSTRALELALYRTYCVPSISALLDRTGEFYRHTQRRYDDTAILIAEMCKWGYERGRGRQARERINWAHSHFNISNDDFLYVLSTFIYVPIHWIDRYGWRPTCRNEKLGYYYFWQAVGTRMGIRDIPPTYEAFEDWARGYERKTFRYTETNAKIGAATRDLFASWFPRPLAPVVRLTIHALLDDAMLDAFGFSRPVPGVRRLIDGVLKLRGRIVRWLPPRRTPNFFTDRRNRTHPGGYEVDSLGPPGLIAAEKRKPGRKSRAC
ncbi:MAG: oxygenase MpaB family protein [Acidiferrobacterales bacterium]|nr:oxygenase MpaB family protein [Acidiferrobacterales bacterium]